MTPAQGAGLDAFHGELLTRETPLAAEPSHELVAALRARLAADMAAARSSLAADQPVWQVSTLNSEHPRAAIFRPLGAQDPVGPYEQWVADNGWTLSGIECQMTLRPALVGETLDFLETIASEMARAEAERLTASLYLLADKKLRGPTAERLAGEWPWQTAKTFGHFPAMGFPMLRSVRMLAFTMAEPTESRARGSWVATEPLPADVAPLAVMERVRDGLEHIKKGAGKLYEQRARAVGETTRNPQMLLEGVDLRASTDLESCFLQGHQLAWLHSKASAVEKDRSLRTVKVASKKHGRAAMVILGTRAPAQGGSRGKTNGQWLVAQSGKKIGPGPAEFVLTHGGFREPVQLALLGDGEAIDAGVMRQILHELSEDGLRDWLFLHKLAEDQGNTGQIRWSWEAHRSVYQKRIRSKNATEHELAAACVARLHRFKSMELRAQRESVNGIEWVRIGPHGLIDIPAGRDELTAGGALTTVARIHLNPAIYEGAGRKHKHFALIPEAALSAPAPELKIIAGLCTDLRYTLDNQESGVLVRRAGTLWDMAGIRGGQTTDRKRWPDATKSLERILDSAKKYMGEGFDWHRDGDGKDARYTFKPPHWWRDRVISGLPPALPRPTGGVPLTGAELKAARAAAGLSLRDLAERTGLTKNAIDRAEKAGGPLPGDWPTRLSLAKLPAVPDR